MNSQPDFMVNADNVYRTRDYIVRQIIGVNHDAEMDNDIFSQDTFFARTPARDRQYEAIFARRFNIDGKRMKSTMYSRKYVE
ncbi:MAG: hypothetical protein NC184_05345 [Roseburia sp.]|nr:hypothetical protein [Roseburia sp.]